MIKEYSIHDILINEEGDKPYYFGTFEGTEDPDIEWPHRHDYYSIIYFTAGEGLNVIDFKEHPIVPNRVFIMVPGQIHNWSFSEHTQGFILLFDKFFAQVGKYTLPYMDVPENFRDLIKEVFNFNIHEYLQKDDTAEQSAKAGISYLNSIFSRLAKLKNYKDHVIPEPFLVFRQLVSGNLDKALTVQDYADMLHITVDKLNSICKDTMGKSAKKLILEQQITEAKRLLYYTHLSVKEIAFALGFEDSSYFTRLFKNKTNSIPIEFRQKVPESIKKVL